jgi:hypothetical protein
MNPGIRIAVVIAALVGAGLIVRAAWPAVAGNLTALKSWNRMEGEIRSMNGDIEFEIGREPDSYRAFAAVDHTWGLSLFKKVPLLVDPANRSRVKPAGLFQMWLSPAEMSALVLLLLAAAWMIAGYGRGPDAIQIAGAPTRARWMFSESPGPLSGGVTLHSPARQWKIVLAWSILGVAMVVIPMLGKGGNPVSRVAYITLGSVFALSLWGLAWHTRSMEISANSHGVRMTSVLGWRDLPWGLVRSVEDQDIFSTYYNGQMRMWELPFPGSTIRVLAFNGEHDRTLMSFSPELESQDSLKRLFELCTEQTGLKMHGRSIALPY